MRLGKLSSGLLALLCCLPTFAAEQAAPRPELVDTSSIVQMLLTLLAVVAVIVMLAVLMRKFNMINPGSSQAIRIVGGLALSSKDRLLLVQVGEEQILISASPGRIGKVHELSQPVQLDAIGTGSVPGNRFAGLLESVMQRSSS